MANKNKLKVRLQHAVIGEDGTSTSSVPVKGEIIFNSALTNFRVGNGTDNYNILSDFLPSAETWTFTTSAGVTVTKHVLVQ